MSGFDNRKNVSRTADAPSFSAVINEGNNVCTASITYKKGFKVGVTGVTARDMDTLMRELTKLDSAVRFYKRGRNEGTLSAKDAAMLAQLRDDKNTSDAVYRTACASFGQKPEPRNITVAPVASTANLPQGVPSLRASAEAWTAFEQEHNDLFGGSVGTVFGVQNVHVIEKWFADEKVQWTADSLAQCYRELKALQCFRTANTLTRGMHGDLQVVQPYSRERILQLRNQQVADVASQPPAGLSDVDRECWEAVHRAYPNLAVNSAGFKQCMRDTLQKWCREHVAEEHPDWFTTNAKGQLESIASKRAEVQAAADRVLVQWVRAGNPNLGQGNKTIKDTRIWLG